MGLQRIRYSLLECLRNRRGKETGVGKLEKRRNLGYPPEIDLLLTSTQILDRVTGRSNANPQPSSLSIIFSKRSSTWRICGVASESRGSPVLRDSLRPRSQLMDSWSLAHIMRSVAIRWCFLLARDRKHIIRCRILELHSEDYANSKSSC